MIILWMEALPLRMVMIMVRHMKVLKMHGQKKREKTMYKTPRSPSSQKSKRSLASTTITCDSPVKRSKNPMVSVF
jgi:hypothetical protein